ncbi:MAG: hypothetical protein IJ087_09870 [Eggerthellaceae bacterium]|nr:hypothetical protein [Eggerthellaceae bacterium]
MAKTKRQLRAEAVERLKQLDEHDDSEDIVKAMVPEGVTVNSANWTVELDTLIDLLTDDELPEGDAVSLLRKVALSEAPITRLCERFHAAPLLPSEHTHVLNELADMVERDYVRRDFVEAYPEWIANLKCSEWMEKAHKLERERDKWKAKAEQLANDGLPAENDVKPQDVDANDASVDTREKLEADVLDYQGAWSLNDSTPIDVTWGIVRGWLDRQAAITERECFERGVFDLGMHQRIAEQDRAIVEYAEKNAELTEQLESSHAKNRSLKAHIAKMQEGRHGWHVKYPELEKKNAELKAENKLLRERKCPGYDPDRHYCERNGHR